MSGIFDFLTQGTGATTTQTGSSSQTLPPWYEDYNRNLLAASIAAAQEPFKLYPEARIPTSSPSTLKSWELAGEFGDEASPLMQAGVGATVRGAAPFDPSQVANFMNPYAAQIADIIGRRGEERYEDKFLSPAFDAFTSAGQFGSTRNMDFVRKAMQDASREITDAQTQALSPAFGQALSAYNQSRQIDQAGGAGALSQFKGALDLLSGAGAAEEGKDKESMDLAYKDFLEQRDQPWSILEKLKAMSSGITIPGSSTSTSTSTQTAGEPSPLAILSAIAALLK